MGRRGRAVERARASRATTTVCHAIIHSLSTRRIDLAWASADPAGSSARSVRRGWPPGRRHAPVGRWRDDAATRRSRRGVAAVTRAAPPAPAVQLDAVARPLGCCRLAVADREGLGYELPRPKPWTSRYEAFGTAASRCTQVAHAGEVTGRLAPSAMRATFSHTETPPQLDRSGSGKAARRHQRLKLIEAVQVLAATGRPPSRTMCMARNVVGNGRLLGSARRARRTRRADR